MERPTGRELIANLRLRHRQEASPAALLQLVIAILAGALWWFTCIYYLMRAPEAAVHTWHIVVIAVPCAAITLAWHFATVALGAQLRTRYSRHVAALFARHDLALRLLAPELPEDLARAAYRGAAPVRRADLEHGALLTERIMLLHQRFPAICRALGDRPWPPVPNALDIAAGICIVVAAILLALLDPLGRGPAIGLAAYALIAAVLLAAGALKLEFANARAAALAGAIAEAFAPVADDRAPPPAG